MITVIIVAAGLLFVGHGLLICLYSIFEMLRLVLFGTGVRVPEESQGCGPREPRQSMARRIRRFDNGGN